MAQLAPVILKDYADVNRTFKPRDITNGVATLVESTGVPIGDNRLTATQSRTANGRQKTAFKLTMPVVQDQTVNGVTRPTLVRTAYAELSVTTDASATTNERFTMQKLLYTLLASTFGAGMLIDLEYPY